LRVVVAGGLELIERERAVCRIAAAV